jgi:hypothetical protein
MKSKVTSVVVFWLFDDDMTTTLAHRPGTASSESAFLFILTKRLQVFVQSVGGKDEIGTTWSSCGSSS